VPFGIVVLFHDSAPSHVGPAPEHFLRLAGVEKVIRIPKNTTWVLQAADHIGLNGRVSLLLGDIMAEQELERLLAGEFEKTSFSSMTRKAREYCSNVLAELVKRMELPENKQAAVRGWKETLLGTENEKHSQLRAILKVAKQLPKRKKEPLGKHKCPLGCGERFHKKLNHKTKKMEKHIKSCWCCRSKLLAPICDLNAEALNELLPLDMFAEIIDAEAEKRRVVEFVLTDEGAFVTKDRQTGEELPDKWWQNSWVVQYRTRESSCIGHALLRSLFRTKKSN